MTGKKEQFTNSLEKYKNKLKLLNYKTIAIRLTTQKITKEQILKHFKEIKIIVVGEELGKIEGKKHFHIYLCSNDIRVDDVRRGIKETFGLKGNKELYVKEAQDADRLLRYTVKDGDIIYRGIDEETINTFKKLAYTTDKKAFQNLIDEYLTTPHMKINDYAVRYIQLKVEHQQNLFDHLVRAHLKTMMIKKGERSAYDYYEHLKNGDNFLN